MENRIAIIAIIVSELDAAEKTNKLLHTYCHYIVGRMGIPYRERGISIITLVLDAPLDILNALSGKLGHIPGIQVKSMLAKQ